MRILKVADFAERADRFVAEAMPELSRSQVKRLFQAAEILRQGKPLKPASKLFPTDEIVVMTGLEVAPSSLEAVDIPLDIIYEDDDFIVVNKQKGLVVHPAPGHKADTLVNALLARPNQALSDLGGAERLGIVHRIDKDTTGLLIVAKNNRIHKLFSDMLSRHEIRRSYLALVHGCPKSLEGTIDAPLARDPNHRQRMAIVASGRQAITHFKCLANLGKFSELRLELETGRTHQIRVHLAYIGNPVLGDPLYARGQRAYKNIGQALHATQLSFSDPRNGQELVFKAAPPPEYLALREELDTSNC